MPPPGVLIFLTHRRDVMPTATFTTSFGNVYEFSFEQQTDGSIRPYIVRQPSYGSRDINPHTIHRLKDGDRYYVCWTTLLKSMNEAMKVAGEWARYTDRYIRTGTPFPTK